MSAHTPGPWRALMPGEYGPTEREIIVVGGVAPDPVTRARFLPVARVFHTQSANPMWRQDEECFANGHLIETAPELLAALKYFVEDAECGCVGGSPDNWHPPPCPRCAGIAAIAKAEGRAT